MLNLLRVSKLQTYFLNNVPFLSCNIFPLLMFFFLSIYLYFKHASILDFNIILFYIWSNDSVRALSLHSWNHFFETLKAKSSFQTSKISLNGCFGLLWICSLKLSKNEDVGLMLWIQTMQPHTGNQS